MHEHRSVPDDGVKASDLRCALQHTERLGQWLGLLRRGQERSETKHGLFKLKVIILLRCWRNDEVWL